MVTRYREKIVFHDGQFMVERRFPKNSQKPNEYLPVESLGFQKNITAMAIVRRLTENLESLDEPQNSVFYEVAISYEIIDSPLAKSLYLKTEKTRKILSENLNHFETYTTVWIKDMQSGILQEAQAENLSGFPYSMVRVSKSKPKKVVFARAKELLDSGQLIGIFNNKELSELIV